MLRTQSKNKKALDKEIAKILDESIEIDKEEDEKYGDSTPYEMPKELVNKTKRFKKIQAAKKKLEEEKLTKINVTNNDTKIMIQVFKQRNFFSPCLCQY